MLTYTFTGDKVLGVITDIISGLAVIGIPVLMFPIFDLDNYKILNNGYLVARVIEGVLMILGGILILNPTLESYRDMIYSDFHIYFFIIGALLFYILLYRSQIIPDFISIWGLLATILLLMVTIIRLFKFDSPVLQVFLLPIILNELFLAFWLLVKGFKLKSK